MWSIIGILSSCGFILINESILSNKNLLEKFIKGDSFSKEYPDKDFIIASLIINPILWLGIFGIIKLFL